MLLAQAEVILLWLFGFSFVTFVAGLFLLPLIVVRVPRDYFARERPPRLRFERRHPALRMALLAAKNLVGLALATTGVIMLVTPGPGIVALIVGISLMDIPGKRTLERRVVSIPTVFDGLNRLRARYGSPPLERPIPRLPAPVAAP